MSYVRGVAVFMRINGTWLNQTKIQLFVSIINDHTVDSCAVTVREKKCVLMTTRLHNCYSGSHALPSLH